MAANNIVEFILSLNANAFRQGLQSAIASLTGLSNHAGQAAQGVGQLGTQIQQTGQSAATLGMQVQQAGQAAQGVGQIGTQAQQASAAVAALNTAVGQFGTQTQQAGQSAATLGTQVQQAGAAVGALSGSIGQTSSAVSALAGSAGQAGAAVNTLANSAGQTSSAVNALAGSAGQAGAAVGSLSGNIGQTGAAVNGLAGSAGQTSSAVNTLASSAGQAGTAINGLAGSAGQAGAAVGTLSGGIGQTGSAVNALAGSAGQAGAAVNTLASSAGQAGTAVGALSGGIGQTGAAVNALASSAGQVGAAIQHAVSHAGTAVQATQTAATAAVSSVQHAVGQTGAALQHSVQQAGQATQTAATSAVSAVQHAATQANTAVQQTAQQAGQAARNMSAEFAKLAVSVAALGFLKASVSEFAGFEDAMLRVQALSKATGEDFEALKGRAEELGAKTRYSAVEAAQGMSQLAAAGYQVSQIKEAIEPVLNAAAAGAADLGQTADQVTNIMGAFQLEANQAGVVADALTAGFTNSATTLTQLANAMVYCGPVANTLGYTLQDTTGVLMALADAGIKGEVAGTALRGGMARLLQPARSASDVIEKYNLQIYNADGSMRDFVDILNDVGEAGMTTGEKIKLFGIEAGPAMMVLLDKGTDALKKYQATVRNSAGEAERIAKLQESGLAGALRRLEAAWKALKNSIGDAIAPAIRQIADAMSALAGWFAEMPEWARRVIAVGAAFTAFIGLFGTLALTVKGVASVFGTFFTVVRSLFAPLASLTANTITYARGVALLSGNVAALKFVLQGLNTVVAAAFAGWFIGDWLNQFEIVRKAGVSLAAGLEKAFLRAKLAWAWWLGTDAEVDAVLQELERADKIYAEMYAEIGTKAEEYKQKAEAAHNGAAEAAKTSAKKTLAITEEELEEMKKRWQEYVQQVRDLQEQIAGRQKSLAAELREMGRSGMDDVSAWRDQRREAEEYMAAARRAAEEAKAAFAGGDTITAAAKWKEAVQYADDAKAAYKALNQEVKEGDQTVISKSQALQTAMQGVKAAGELGISVLKEQQETTLQAMKTLEDEAEKAGDGLSEMLTQGMDEAEQKWLETFRKMGKSAEEAGQQVYKVWQNAAGFWTNVDDAFSAGFSKSADNFTVAWDGAYAGFEQKGKDAAAAVSKAIDQAAKDRTATIYVRHVEQRALGGLIGAAGAALKQLASGGKLPGYGGGDKVSALLEAGEFVMRKEAVRKFGSGFFESLNSLKLPDLSSLIPALPKPALAAAVPNPAADKMILELRLPGGDTVTASVSGNDAEELRRLNRRVSNLGFRR